MGRTASSGGAGSVCEREWLVGPYLDGELPAGERDGIEEHLETCDHCRTLAVQLRSLDRLARARTPPPAVSAEEWGRVWEAVRQRAAGAPPAIRPPLGRWWLPAAAAAALLALGIWVCFRLVSEPPSGGPDTAGGTGSIIIEESSNPDATPEIDDEADGGVIRYHLDG